MPTEDERRLLALARAQAQNREAASELPDLDPGILLSPAGQRELEAAQQLARPRQVEVMAKIATGEPNINGDVFTEELLQRVMMDGHGEPFEMPSPEEIQFDTEGLIEGSTAPNEAARFQIGRESPPRRPFGYPNASGVDGVVVSQRGSDGRFQASVRVPRDSTMHRALMEGRVSSYSMSSESSAVTESLARVRAERTQSETVIRAVDAPRPSPTRWERLNGPDPFED